MNISVFVYSGITVRVAPSHWFYNVDDRVDRGTHVYQGKKCLKDHKLFLRLSISLFICLSVSLILSSLTLPDKRS